MKIYIKCESHRTIEVKISIAATVKSLKVQIESLTSIPIEQQFLYKDKFTILTNDQILSEALIKPLSCLTLKHNLPPRSFSLNPPVCQTISNLRRFTADSKNKSEPFEVFFNKCREGDYYFISQKLEESADILKIFSIEGWTCLHYAAFQGNSELIQLYIDFDVDINQLTRDKKWSSLHLVCIQGHIEALELILNQNNILVDMSLEENCTPLHCACLNGNRTIIEKLLLAKANCTIENHLGQLPIDLASSRESKEILAKFMGKSEELPEYFEGPLNLRKPFFDLKGWGVLRPTEGSLMIYKSQKVFNNRGQPIKTFNIKEMNEIKRCKSPVFCKDFYFHMTSLNTGEKFFFYSEYEEIANCWVKNLFTSLLYRQSHSKKVEVIETLLLDFPDTPDIGFYSFEVLDQIGSGSFSVVHLARKKDTDELFALKSMSKQYLIQKNCLKNAIAECRVLSILNSPFIIRLHFCFKTARSLYMVLEYCKYGSLSLLLQSLVTLPLHLAKLYVAEIILAIEHLHSLNILYRDLKPDNILISNSGHIKLADFGMVKENFLPTTLSKSFCGTPAYLSPEMLSRSNISKKIDHYAIGCVLFELLCGYPPFYSEKIEIVFERIAQGKVKFPESVPEDAKILIEKLMQRNPENRPEFESVKNYPFFEDICWESLSEGKLPALDFSLLKV